MSETTVPEGLAGRLREATGAAHTAAERTAFVKHLFKGTLPREGYVGLIRALHPVYVALEAAMGAHKDDAVVGMVYDPALNRAESLEQDLEFFAGKDWKLDPGGEGGVGLCRAPHQPGQDDAARPRGACLRALSR